MTSGGGLSRPSCHFLDLCTCSSCSPTVRKVGGRSSFERVGRRLCCRLADGFSNSCAVALMMPRRCLARPRVMCPIAVSPSVAYADDGDGARSDFIGTNTPSTAKGKALSCVHFNGIGKCGGFKCRHFADLPALPANTGVADTCVGFAFHSKRDAPSTTSNVSVLACYIATGR